LIHIGNQTGTKDIVLTDEPIGLMEPTVLRGFTGKNAY
jgi:hypothetical protein